MSRRPPVDLMALTSEQAIPMTEAVQRTAPAPPASPQPLSKPPTPLDGERQMPSDETKTANLQGLSLRVPASFRRRFICVAAEADMKLNELLYAAFEAYERGQGPKKS